MRSISYIFSPEDNLVAATNNLLKRLNIKVPLKVIKDTLLSKPDYPSLLAVSDGLKQLNIVSEAYQIPSENLDKLPVPFLAHFKSGSFVTITGVDKDSVTYMKDDQSLQKIDIANFLYKWSGAVLLAEDQPETFNKMYADAYFREKLKFIRIPILILILTLLFAVRFISITGRFTGNDLWSYFGFGLFSVFGLIISSLLLWQDYDKDNTYLEKICSFNKKTNCNAVLNSSASKFLGFGWSEIGFFYFLGSLIYLLNSNHDRLHLLILINLISLSYILFSIYYQANIVKQWCILCLGIQAILLAEFLTNLFASQLNSHVFPNWKYINFFILFAAFAIPITFWAILKPVFYNFKNNEKAAYGFKRLKGNYEIFSSFLNKQSPIINNPSGLGIMLGNPGAKNTLIKVCNPYCGPCAKSFPDMQNLLKNNPNWKAQIIFTAMPDQEDSRSLPVAHFLQMSETEDSNSMIDILADWYNAEAKDYKLYAARHPINVDFENQKIKLAAMDEWCKKENIEHTPTYFTNGRAMHDNYNLEDLVFLT